MGHKMFLILFTFCTCSSFVIMTRASLENLALLYLYKLYNINIGARVPFILNHSVHSSQGPDVSHNVLL